MERLTQVGDDREALVADELRSKSFRRENTLRDLFLRLNPFHSWALRLGSWVKPRVKAVRAVRREWLVKCTSKVLTEMWRIDERLVPKLKSSFDLEVGLSNKETIHFHQQKVLVN
jgi:hypothetical protein